MITVRLYLDAAAAVIGFDADNHGDKIVCAAVSALTINAVNSMESLTSARFTCDCRNEQHIRFRLVDEDNRDARLLLSSLRLGLCSISEEYPRDLSVEEIKAASCGEEGASNHDSNEFTVFRP